MSRLLLLGLLALGAAGVLTGCSGAGPGHRSVKSARTQHCEPGYRALGTPRLAYAVAVRSAAIARRLPDGHVIARFGRFNRNRFPTVFGVRGAILDSHCAPTWFRVQLPIRPNGSVGWVPASQVNLGTVHTRIEVDLSTRRLTFFRSGQPVLTTKVAVGAPGTPTPAGNYYVNQRLVPKDPHGPYGPAAVGISAYSNVLTGWTEGGPIGIHGTNEPWSIGHFDSNGCVRVPNSVARRLFKLALAGTPVVIHA